MLRQLPQQDTQGLSNSYQRTYPIVSAPDLTDAAADGLHHRYVTRSGDVIHPQLRPLGLGPRLHILKLEEQFFFFESLNSPPLKVLMAAHLPLRVFFSMKPCLCSSVVYIGARLLRDCSHYCGTCGRPIHKRKSTANLLYD